MNCLQMMFYWFLEYLLGYEEAIWPKNGDKSCRQSNFDKRLSDIGSFLVI
jgi:hypothetical protein